MRGKNLRRTTIEDVRFVRDNWEKASATALGESLGFPYWRVSTIAANLRKQGLDLPKKVKQTQNIYKLVAREILDGPAASRKLFVK
jgi:hypothetical protein